jgi:energy-coupling factor transporter ATP-binding protein EcfA2
MTSSAVPPSSQAAATNQLATALKRLDAMLSTALQAMEAQLGTAAVRDPHRGLYIAPEDVTRLLSQTPGTSLLWSAKTAPAEPNPLSERLATLQTRFSLTTFDLDVLLIAIAPAVDSRYERIYAYLQDDVTKKQPSVDLALNLLCHNFETKLQARQRFAPRAPLLYHQLVSLVEPPNLAGTSLLSHFLAVDETTVAFLLGQGEIDPLDGLARPIPLRHSWDDLVLPPAPLQQLQEFCLTIKHQTQVYDDWGFGQKLAYGRGLSALFVGPSGTGKTMAASIIARAVERTLYAIDLSMVVSKYIGETEKNLGRIFDAAEHSNAILFFDEADALFGKRTDISDAHDRYANLEVSYLLQRIEQFSGVVILASNLRKNMDEAFVRRMNFIINFPIPKAEQRRQIWQSIWPDHAPQAEDVEADWLAKKFELSGGNIRNVALASAFLAAEDEQPIQQRHIIQAVRREYQKLGRILEDSLLK